ncbi:MAG: M1 family metallopeptidase [Chitinophagales bacterium]
MKFKQIKKYLFLVLLLSLTACKTSKKSVNDEMSAAFEEQMKAQFEKALQENQVDVINDYHESRTQRNDLVHTKLEVRFDWEKTYLYGKANLTFAPYYYPINTINIDAKGFDIQAVELVGKNGNSSLEYKYDSLQIAIQLDKTYEKGEEYEIFIDYTAKPNELKNGGGEAITDDRGLFFINPDGSEKDKPQQIWTQGQSEASSCWFPTLDTPNQRSSQEIYMTVQDRFVTLSNGKMLRSTKNADGTRTDYWKQDLPHAPYLFMMGVGDFAVVKDKWKNIELTYYVEPEFEAHAKAIFGKTPKMLEFFSNKLKVDYPWDKYGQMIVREYVSGAMENTGAVIFGDFVQATTRELMDWNSEDIIAHELIHHWFGDLVTCESWSNLTLNEGFATYGEYLWDEHEYGDFHADHIFQRVLEGYLDEANETPKNLIRFYYDEKDDMFDRHSYNKGGRVLHSLRKYVGDNAFFDAVKLYLDTNKFQSVEIHDLRLAFEKTTGEDLNWFFNQWFLGKGHPVLDINYEYDENKKQATVKIEQQQDVSQIPVFRLPLKVDVYENGKATTHNIVMTEATQEFSFKVGNEPQFINVDADKALICEKMDNKTAENYIAQAKFAPKYLDKREALLALAALEDKNKPEIVAIFDAAMQHEAWAIREIAIENYDFENWKSNNKLLKTLEDISKNDKKPAVRVSALTKIAETKSTEYSPLYHSVLETDSSYLVMNSAVSALGTTDVKEAMQIAEKYEDNKHLLYSILKLYKDNADESKAGSFTEYYETAGAGDRWGMVNYYADYIMRFHDMKMLDDALAFFEKVTLEDNPWWLKFASVRGLDKIAAYYEADQKDLEYEIKNNKELDKIEAAKKIALFQELEEKARATIESIKAKETDEKLLKRYERF